LRHRILTNFNARAQKVTAADIIEKLLGEVKPDGRTGHETIRRP
jgi:hypothetical protein